MMIELFDEITKDIGFDEAENFLISIEKEKEKDLFNGYKSNFKDGLTHEQLSAVSSELSRFFDNYKEEKIIRSGVSAEQALSSLMSMFSRRVKYEMRRLEYAIEKLEELKNIIVDDIHNNNISCDKEIAEKLVALISLNCVEITRMIEDDKDCSTVGLLALGLYKKVFILSRFLYEQKPNEILERWGEE